MDQNALIDKITEEVMKRLSEELSKKDTTFAKAGRNLPSRAVPVAFAQYIDHTLLKPDASQAEFDTLCEEAIKYKFKSVCVNSGRVAYVTRKVQGTSVLVCSVVGFPLGAMESRAKAFETRKAIEEGAKEVDMVINIDALKSGHLKIVEEDIRAVRRATRGTTILKVILETCLLSDAEKVFACEISKKAGADFVKTSTGFSTGGATVEDVALMRRTVGPEMGVKASGGIRDFAKAMTMIEAGATRLGTSSSVAIVTGTQGQSHY